MSVQKVKPFTPGGKVMLLPLALYHLSFNSLGYFPELNSNLKDFLIDTSALKEP